MTDPVYELDDVAPGSNRTVLLWALAHDKTVLASPEWSALALALGAPVPKSTLSDYILRGWIATRVRGTAGRGNAAKIEARYVLVPMLARELRERGGSEAAIGATIGDIWRKAKNREGDFVASCASMLFGARILQEEGLGSLQTTAEVLASSGNYAAATHVLRGLRLAVDRLLTGMTLLEGGIAMPGQGVSVFFDGTASGRLLSKLRTVPMLPIPDVNTLIPSGEEPLRLFEIERDAANTSLQSILNLLHKAPPKSVIDAVVPRDHAGSLAK